MSYITSLNIHNGRIGKIGEDFATEFLESKGHAIVERNYRNRYGEIDIITKKDKKIHIIEVKTSQSKYIRPEENMHAKKMKKVARMAQVYCGESLYCIDLIGVSLNSDCSLNKITYLENLEIF